MLNFIKTPKGMIITGIVVLAVILIIANWTKVKGWFSPSFDRFSTTPVTTANDALGRMASPQPTLRPKCQKIGGTYYYNGYATTYADCAIHGAL